MRLESKHYIVIAMLAFIVIVLLRGQGFLGAAISIDDQTLCTSTNGTITTLAPSSQTYQLKEGWNDFVLVPGTHNASKLLEPIMSKVSEIDVWDCPSSQFMLFLPTEAVPEGRPTPVVNETTGSIFQFKLTSSASLNSDKIIEAGSCVGDKSANTSCMYAKYYDTSAHCPVLPSGFNQYCSCPADNTWVSGHGCIVTANMNQTLCTNTAGTWDSALRKCVCPANTKFQLGCQDCTATLLYKLANFCTDNESVCMLSGEALPLDYFSTKADCDKALQCRIDSDCTKEENKPNDCSLFFKEEVMTIPGKCTTGRCTFQTPITPTPCTNSELWWQEYIRWVIVGILAVILLIYLLWERGPKRGFFRGRRR